MRVKLQLSYQSVSKPALRRINLANPFQSITIMQAPQAIVTNRLNNCPLQPVLMQQGQVFKHLLHGRRFPCCGRFPHCSQALIRLARAHLFRPCPQVLKNKQAFWAFCFLTWLLRWIWWNYAHAFECDSDTLLPMQCSLSSVVPHPKVRNELGSPSLRDVRFLMTIS